MSEQASTYLIREAVAGVEATPLDRSNQQFAKSFSRLVYTQIWEDPVVDVAAMALEPHHRIITIGSGGCNALSYLTADPAEVHAVDLNFAHIALTDLKRAAFATFEQYEDIVSYFVRASGPRNHDLFHRHLSTALRNDTRAYWMSGGRKPRHEAFVSGFYQTGLLGVAVRLCRLLGRLHGVRLSDVLAIDNAEAQRAWARKHIRPIFEGPLLSLMFSLRHPLFLLGIPPRQFNLLCDGSPKRMAFVLADRVEQLAGAAKSSENYFMWQAFGQQYAPDSETNVPPYLMRDHFQLIRSRLDRLRITHGSLTDVLLRSESASLDRYVLLDAQDWMDQPTITALWAQMTRTARAGARVIFRTAGRHPPFAEYAHGDWAAWRRLDALSAELHPRDRSGIYGGFHVYELAD